jgi:alpha-glucosidase
MTSDGHCIIPCWEQDAKHKLMIDFHGCYNPPRSAYLAEFHTCEAFMGNDSVWFETNDPVHKTTLPFTRQLAGPMDYTPGSKLNETRQSVAQVP